MKYVAEVSIEDFPAKKDTSRDTFPVVSLLNIALGVFGNQHYHSFVGKLVILI